MPTDSLAIEGRLLVQHMNTCNLYTVINLKPDRMFFCGSSIFTISRSIFSPNLTFF